MIFEGSCDTEDWSNDAENTAAITEINYIYNMVIIFNCFYSIFDQINADLVNKIDLKEKLTKLLNNSADEHKLQTCMIQKSYLHFTGSLTEF